ncbi:MAG: hypothetical protein ACM37V_06340 [Gemmatimonadota bacterium]
MLLRRAFLIGGWMIVGASQAPAQGTTAQVPCDSNLLQLAAPVNGYRPRGDRCEGVYARQVAGTTLFLSSFTETFEKYDLDADDPLIIRWAAPADSGIQLRAETIKAGRYYRMDTRAAPRDSVYRWPNRVLSSERLARSDLGVLGWTRITLGGRRRVAYVPLTVTQKTSPTACAPLQVAFSTETRLTEVFVSLTQLDSTGAETRVIKKDEPLGRGFYPAGSPILVSLRRADLAAPGLYSFKVSATLSPRGNYSHEYLLLIPKATACPK